MENATVTGKETETEAGRETEETEMEIGRETADKEESRSREGRRETE